MPFKLGARCFVDITFINPFNNGSVAATIASVLQVGKDTVISSESHTSLVRMRDTCPSTAAAASPGSLLEMHLLGPAPDLLSQRLGYGVKESVLS